MTDVVGWRAKVGVIVPSTNTVVEHDLAVLKPPGLTFHAGRMLITDPAMGDDGHFEALIAQLRATIRDAVDSVMTCQPDHLLMGMSAETFWGGVEGNAAFEQRIQEQSGLAVTTGASACRAALEAFGARRIAVFSPYQPVADMEVERFFTEAGFEVATITGLRCPSATAIAQVDGAELTKVVYAVNAPDVDAIVQVGTNLSFVAHADSLERLLAKPVLSINAATLWHTMRTLGIQDKVDGAGLLLREH